MFKLKEYILFYPDHNCNVFSPTFHPPLVGVIENAGFQICLCWSHDVSGRPSLDKLIIKFYF